MAVSIFLVFAFSLIMLFPRAMLAAKLELEYKRLFDPKIKSREVKLLPYLIPYYGGVKLCENMGSDFLAHMSKVVGVLTVLCVVNTTIFRVMGITDGWYPVISIYCNMAVFTLNYLMLVVIAFRCGRTIQAPLSAALCIVPPLSFYMQTTVVRHFFKVNKDDLRDTFAE
ncbi:MAG: hypothetical protein IJ583_09545 [Firmicutes bacterium]|nr:hypothetical protein [Bacillota bacterium]